MTESTAREDLTREVTVWSSSDQAANPEALVNELLEQGWVSPDDTNALRNQATAYNSLLWQLATVLGYVEEGAVRVELDVDVVLEHALAAIARDRAASTGAAS